MKIIIPMAGLGDRFVKAGYLDPKPLIKVKGEMIIEKIIKMFSPEDEFIFICNNYHLNVFGMENILKSLVPNCKIFSIEQHKKGPVYTVSKVFDEIKDDEEVVVTYCDNPYLWDYKDFKKKIKNWRFDGSILSHTGFHPHTLSSTKMAFMHRSPDFEECDLPFVDEIKEKECYTDNPQNEQASTGTYYFSRGEYIKKYFQELMDKNINYNGEFYVTLVYNLMVKDGLKIGYYPTKFVTVFGTPEEVRHFEAWQTILSENQVKNEDDLLKSYKYWKEYKEYTKFLNQIK